MITYRYEYAEMHFNEDGSIKTVFANKLGKTLEGIEFNAGQVTLADADLVSFLSSIDAIALAQRDQLAIDKAALEASLGEMTADRNKQASDLASMTAAFDALQEETEQSITNLQSQHSEALANLQAQLTELQTIQQDRDSIQAQLSEAQATIATLNEQLAKPVVESRPGLNYLYPYEFRHRFTPESRARLREAAKTNDQLADYLETVFSVRWVVVTDQETIQGVQALALMGLIDPERVSAILAPVEHAEHILEHADY